MNGDVGDYIPGFGTLEKKVKELEKRLSALENPQEHIDPTRANGGTVTNPCGCILPKDNNVSHHRSPITEGPDGTVLCLSVYQCLKCMRIVKMWQEVRQEQQPLITIPGFN